MKNGISTLARLAVGVMAGTVWTVTGFADAPDPANYVGIKTCGICHKKEDSGNQIGNWEKSPHARAFQTLGTPAAKEIATKAGIDDPQKSGKCLKCHSTAY